VATIVLTIRQKIENPLERLNCPVRSSCQHSAIRPSAVWHDAARRDARTSMMLGAKLSPKFASVPARYVHLRSMFREIANCSEYRERTYSHDCARAFLPSFLPGQTQTHIVRVPSLLPRCSISSLNRTHLHARLSPLVIPIPILFSLIFFSDNTKATSMEWFLFYFEEIVDKSIF